MLALKVVLLLCLSFEVYCQHVAPGVPPQQYQMHPQQQQMHHQQQMHPQQMHPQQQQMHVQQQMHPQQQQMHVQPQVPQQMHQQPVVQQQAVPVAPQHHHPHSGQPQVLNVANIAQEKEHIAEHLAVPMDTSKMSEQELQFHYFKMHDSDNNNKLDGCELIKSLIHWHEQGHTDPATGQKQAGAKDKLFSDEELHKLIDPILSMDDTNGDGYIDYPEFVQAQMKAAAGPPPK